MFQIGQKVYVGHHIESEWKITTIGTIASIHSGHINVDVMTIFGEQKWVVPTKDIKPVELETDLIMGPQEQDKSCVTCERNSSPEMAYPTLLPCPFCQSEYQHIRSNGEDSFWVMCCACGARKGQEWLTELAAIECWNFRVQPKEVKQSPVDLDGGGRFS